MKQLFTLIAFFCCVLCAFAEEVTYDFSNSVPQPWTCSVQPFGYETSGSFRGTQFNKATPEVTLTLAGVTNVTKVVVTCSSNIADLNDISVVAGGSVWGTETFAKETNVEKAFTGAAVSGSLCLDLSIKDKSVYISKVVVTCDEAGGGTGENPGEVVDPDDQELDPNYEYPEPTIVWPSGEVGSNAAYSFVYNNIKVSTTVGGQTEDYFGCNAGQTITFTATQPIKALVIHGYVKQGFEASCDHGDIMYVDASVDAVEANPVLAILDVDSKSVTISCVKQMRCYVAQVYFEENPDIEEGGGEEEDERDYSYEPTEQTTLDITFDQVQYEDYSFIGFPYTDMYFISEDYEMEMTAFTEPVPVTMLPVGTYEINDSYEEGTIEASPGGDYDYDYPSYIATDFQYYEEYESWGYGAAYYLMSGTVTVAADPAGVKVTVDAKTYNGSTVKATFVGCPDGDEEYLEGIANVYAPSAREDKRFSDGRITIRHAGKTYTTAGLRLK